MSIKQRIYCPNCGDRAERFHYLETKIIRTSCNHCDYLLVQCSETGRVIEAYAPGIYSTVNFSEPVVAKREARNCPQAALASSPRE